MYFQVYTNNASARYVKGISNLSPIAIHDLVKRLIDDLSLGFGDKIRISIADQRDPRWFEVLGSSVNGKVIDYSEIDLYDPNPDRILSRFDR